MPRTIGRDYSELTPDSLCSCGCGRKVASRTKYGRTALTVQSHLSRRCLGLKQRYGLSVTERDNMLATQDNRCATCRNAIAFGDGVGVKRSEQAVIDHCHTTGKIRGILCSSCNIALGNIRDSTDTLSRMLEYVR